ncbi:MAG: OmpA family protein [Brevinematales bacterium]|nr:OmpA family protein [Brevinematales bacterium]
MKKVTNIRTYITVIYLLIGYLLHGYDFSWKLNTNEILRVKSFVKQNIYTNNTFVKYVEILNKASIDVKSISTVSGRKYYGIEGIFYVFSKDYSEDVEFKLDETHISKYVMEENGKMSISKEFIMPVVRDVPVFVKRDIKPGDEWFFRGKEFHKIGFTELFDLVEIEFNAHYKFSRTTNIQDKEIAIINIKYGFSDYFSRTKIIQYLSGASEIEYYWDIAEGKPYYMKENYFFNALYKNGISIIYSGSSESSLEIVNRLKEDEKKEVISKVQEALKKQENIEVLSSENEINITIPDIVFDFNKYTIKQEFIKTLSNLAEILKKYNQADIIVEGHTDDIGEDEYNLKLSQLRAKEVAKILINLGINPNRISYIGYGETKPKVPNTSPQNRAKNRRVEIKLIWGK